VEKGGLEKRFGIILVNFEKYVVKININKREFDT
jgi:hypothetical protein